MPTRTRENKRKEILEAAQEAIAARGVRGLRIEDVAERAGVAPSLLYYHFGSRAGLLRATLDHANEMASTARLASGDDRRPALKVIEDALVAEISDDPAVKRNSLVWGELCASAAFDPPLRAAVALATSAWTKAFEKRIRAGKRDGSVRGDVQPRVSAERLGALVDGLATRWHAGAIETSRARRLLKQAIRDELAP